MKEPTTASGNNFWLQKVYADKNGAYCSFEITSANDENDEFPYSFTIRMKFKLNTTGLFVDQILQNSPNVPFSFGWRPYFTFSDPKHGQPVPINRTLLTVPTTNFVVTDTLGLPTGSKSKLAVEGNIIDLRDIILNNTMDYNDLGVPAVTKVYSPDRNFTIVLTQDPKYHYMQIETRGHSITLQPQTATANALNEGTTRGLLMMTDNSIWQASFNVKLE